jgi:hypothetical protein
MSGSLHDEADDPHCGGLRGVEFFWLVVGIAMLIGGLISILF